MSKSEKARICPHCGGPCIYWRPTYVAQTGGSCYCNHLLDTGKVRDKHVPCRSQRKK